MYQLNQLNDHFFADLVNNFVFQFDVYRIKINIYIEAINTSKEHLFLLYTLPLVVCLIDTQRLFQTLKIIKSIPSISALLIPLNYVQRKHILFVAVKHLNLIISDLAKIRKILQKLQIIAYFNIV